jgi:hypothetical protein
MANATAEHHLAKAGEYLGKGDEFYARAAAEIIAAQKADSTLSQRQIGERFGKSQKWVARLVTWGTSESPATTPIDWERGSHATTAEIEAGVEKAIETMPPEKAVEVLGALTSRPDVIDHLADDGDAANAALHKPLDRVLERRDEKEGHDRTRRVPKPTFGEDGGLTGLLLEWTLIGHLLDAVDLAKKHGVARLRFLHEHLVDAVEVVEMAIAEDDPMAVIDDFLARLHAEHDQLKARAEEEKKKEAK